jgi:hypothetical protein
MIITTSLIISGKKTVNSDPIHAMESKTFTVDLTAKREEIYSKLLGELAPLVDVVALEFSKHKDLK